MQIGRASCLPISGGGHDDEALPVAKSQAGAIQLSVADAFQQPVEARIADDDCGRCRSEERRVFRSQVVVTTMRRCPSRSPKPERYSSLSLMLSSNLSKHGSPTTTAVDADRKSVVSSDLRWWSRR